MLQKYMLVLFPICFENWDYVDKKIKENFSVIGIKEVALIEKQKFELIYNLYEGEPWLGDKNNNWEGVYYKMNSCFPDKNQNVKFYYIFSEQSEVKKIKEEIRIFCKNGNHSIHSTDDEQKARKLKLKYF